MKLVFKTTEIIERINWSRVHGNDKFLVKKVFSQSNRRSALK